MIKKNLINFKEKNFFYVVFFTFLFLLILITDDYSRDIDSYKILYDYINKKSLKSTFQNFYYEPLFIITFYILSKIFNFFDLFFILGSIIIFIKLKIFWKNYENFLFAALLYLSLQLLSMHEASQLRTAIVTTFFLYAISSKNTSIVITALITLLSMMFHKIGIIYFILKSRKYYIISVILVLLFIFFKDYLIIKFQNLYNLTEYLSVKSYKEFYNLNNTLNKASYTNSIFWSQFFITIFGFLNFKYLKFQQRRGLYLISFSVIVYAFLVNTPNISSRMIEISLLGLVPLFTANKIKWNLNWYIKLSFLSYIIIYQCTLYAQLFYSNLSK